MSLKTGGQLVADVIEKENVKCVFCVPGESYLPVLDALYDKKEIKVISARHEGGAGFMADGYAKASGHVGVCMVTRGPGATNASIAIHTAKQDSIPLIVLVGQISRDFKDKEAFQEVDLVTFFRTMCKWTVEINSSKRIPELLHRAFYLARSGRPGPVVVSLPQDMLYEKTEARELQPFFMNSPLPVDSSVRQAIQLINEAKKPAIIAGGGITMSHSTSLLVQFSERLNIPVATGWRRMDAFPNTHKCYAGQLWGDAPDDLLQYMRSADVVIAIGTRLSQITTINHTLLSNDCRLIHVDISSDVFGKGEIPYLPIISDASLFLQKALSVSEPNDDVRRKQICERLHEHYLTFSMTKPDYSENFLDMNGMMYDLLRWIPENTIIASDAGNFFGWVSRYYRFKHENCYIGPTSGAMGFGLPGAIGAKLAHPDQLVVAFAGDGGFMMTIQELETAVRYHIPIIAIVANNNKYGTIYMHQQHHFPNRTIATKLTNPDFSKLMVLLGGHGEYVEQNKDFIPALERAIDSGLPSVIELKVNPKIISTNSEVTSIRSL